MRGTVRSSDAHAGTGVVEAEDGRTLAFHCTAIADGSRTIDAGTPVEFEVTPGLHGRWEATGIARL